MTTEDLHRAPGTPASWPAVRELLLATGLPLDGAREHLDTFRLAYRGERLVASVGLEVYGDVALLRSLAVRPELQHRGIGRLLTESALDEARRRGLRAVYLLTTTAVGFFARLGFHPVARSEVPPPLLASTQFNGVCPDTATPMALELAAPSPSGTGSQPPPAAADAGSAPAVGARGGGG